MVNLAQKISVESIKWHFYKPLNEFSCMICGVRNAEVRTVVRLEFGNSVTLSHCYVCGIYSADEMVERLGIGREVHDGTKRK